MNYRKHNQFNITPLLVFLLSIGAGQLVLADHPGDEEHTDIRDIQAQVVEYPASFFLDISQTMPWTWQTRYQDFNLIMEKIPGALPMLQVMY